MTEATDFNGKIIAEFRATGGKVGGRFAGSDILLLHHTGARTGTERISPLAYQRVGESFAVFGSKAGGPANPHWYHNLLAHPETTIEVGGDTLKVRARVAEPAERDVIWERQKERAPHFAEYERTAAPRKIPVVVLDRC
jgi:deazaflavin-dependent oxidoreductase (nitroreductase family)